MALAIRSVTRATQPHLPTLAGSLAPLLAVANCGSFGLRYETGRVVIEQGSFSGCDLTAIDAAVAAAPTTSAYLDAKNDIDNNVPLWARGWFLALLDQINVLRTQPSTTFSAITVNQAITAVKAKIDTL